MWKNLFKELKRKDHQRYLGGLDIFKYIGPGLLVTVGFIDPGNWASNFAAGSDYGYALLWVVTLSTVMLIVLQHNVAHLGIVTGLCLSEAANKYTPKWIARPILGSAVLASISTSLAEILGGAIALEMLFDIPIIAGAVLTTVFVLILLFTNSYRRIERGESADGVRSVPPDHISRFGHGNNSPGWEWLYLTGFWPHTWKPA